MTGARPIVRAVVHDLGRTGVPVAMTRLATWPGTADAVDLHVVSRHDGPLRAVLERAGIPVVVLEPSAGRSPAATLAAGGAQLGHPGPGAAVLSAAWRRRVRSLPDPGTVLVQGAGAWPVARALRAAEAPRVVVHLHELEVALRRSVPPGQVEAIAAADQVLAVAEPVAALARSIGVPDGRIAIVPGTVEAVTGITPGRADVVTVGEAGWRKGTDRAIAAAHALRRIDPSFRWHWIGRGPEPGWAYAHGAELPVAFHAPVDDPWSVIAHPAAVVVTSREDPLPLVALEAGARGLPVIAFRGAGGLDDLLADGRGWLVDPTDPRDLAAVVAEVAAGGTAEPTEALRAHLDAHHRTEVVAPRWLDALLGPG